MGPSLAFPTLQRPSTTTAGAFACPLCGVTMAANREICPRCGGNLVRPREEAEVYSTVLPLCGQQCDLQRFESNRDPSMSGRSTSPIDSLVVGVAQQFEALLRAVA